MVYQKDFIMNILLAVCSNQLDNNVCIIYDGKKYTIDTGKRKITPNFNKGFFSLSYDLAFSLMV